MKKNLTLLNIIFIITISLPFGEGQGGAFAQSREVPFTLDDRDRLIRLEERVSSLEQTMNVKFESINQRFESLEKSMNIKFESQQQQINDLKWGFGIIITLIIALFAYIVYDRRTTLYPLLERTEQLALKDRQIEQEIKELQELKKLKEVIKEYAQTDVKLTELLRRAAIL